MNKCRAAVREWLKNSDGDCNLRDKLDNSQNASNISWKDLWEGIRLNEDSTTPKKRESLLLAESLIKCWTETERKPEDVDVINEIYSWVSQSILPSPEYAGYYEEAYVADDQTKIPGLAKLKIPRLEATVGVSILGDLNQILPIRETEDPVSIITTLAAFTCERDPWTTAEAYTKASAILAITVPSTPTEKDFLAYLLKDIHERKIKPIFSTSKNPDITPAGRKNFYPSPQPQFDPSLFSPGREPWKNQCVYVITVLSWVLSQYPPSDKTIIEDQFRFLYPPIETLIEDSSLFFKTRGCDLLSQFLAPIETSRSDILRRSRLAPKLENNLNDCLLSIPTITPEDESLRLLASAYPALFSVIRTNYPLSHELRKKERSSMNASLVDKSREVSDNRHASIKRILTVGIIRSYNHISSPSPGEDTFISSYPYPRLSTLLLSQLSPALRELGTTSIRYIHNVMPLLSDTLTNPFGTSYLPLIVAAVEATRTLILNAWPRISGWRGEILNAIGVCWVSIWDDEREGTLGGGKDGSEYSDQNKKLDRNGDHEYYRENIPLLKAEMQELALFLRCAVAASNRDASEGDDNANDPAVDIDSELKLLANADERLRPLLLPEAYPTRGYDHSLSH